MDYILDILKIIPCDFLEPLFMRQALLAILLLTPITAIFGIHVIGMRMAFFSDAVGHSAFTGLAAGLLLGWPATFAVPAFGVLVGILIILAAKSGRLGPDAAIGVIFSGVVAIGLAIASRAPSLARDIQRYLYGDILTIQNAELWALAALFAIVIIFEILAFNKLWLASLAPDIAQKSAPIEFIFAILLAILVMLCVRAVGALLVTALLVVPASAAKNLAASMASLLWWSVAISITCGISGLAVSAQPWAPASGATIILAACLAWIISLGILKIWGEKRWSGI